MSVSFSCLMSTRASTIRRSSRSFLSLCQYLLQRSTWITISFCYWSLAKGPSPSGDREQPGDESHCSPAEIKQACSHKSVSNPYWFSRQYTLHKVARCPGTDISTSTNTHKKHSIYRLWASFKIHLKDIFWFVFRQNCVTIWLKLLSFREETFIPKTFTGKSKMYQNKTKMLTSVQFTSFSLLCYFMQE